MEGKAIICVGNLAEGFKFVGVFEDFDAACEYATMYLYDKDNWIATLEAPKP